MHHFQRYAMTDGVMGWRRTEPWQGSAVRCLRRRRLGLRPTRHACNYRHTDTRAERSLSQPASQRSPISVACDVTISRQTTAPQHTRPHQSSHAYYTSPLHLQTSTWCASILCRCTAAATHSVHHHLHSAVSGTSTPVVVCNSSA